MILVPSIAPIARAYARAWEQLNLKAPYPP
jgi:hypothetical protein